MHKQVYYLCCPFAPSLQFNIDVTDSIYTTPITTIYGIKMFTSQNILLKTNLPAQPKIKAAPSLIHSSLPTRDLQT